MSGVVGGQGGAKNDVGSANHGLNTGLFAGRACLAVQGAQINRLRMGADELVQDAVTFGVGFGGLPQRCAESWGVAIAHLDRAGMGVSRAKDDLH